MLETFEKWVITYKDVETYMITSCVFETWERISPTWSTASCCKMNNVINNYYNKKK